MQNKITKWSLLLLFLLLITLPFFIAGCFSPDGLVFGGFLQNPLDGNSYLAKMREGFDGKWLFTLPFTSENGEGTFLFTFYIALGHLARITQIPLLMVFHAARLCAAILMFFCIQKCFHLFLPADVNLINGMFTICLFGSGLGSLAYIATGEMTADFWVAEAYPFLSAYSNPHFPLGLSLLSFIFIKYHNDLQPKDVFILCIGNFFLSIILPFAFVLGLVVISVKEMVKVVRAKKNKSISPVLLSFLCGMPIVVYQQWMALTDPLLRVWNQQNITASPALWDILISFSPILILAIIGMFHTIRNSGELDIPVIWVLVSGVFLIVPLALQRRFMLGLYIPLAVLAGRGIYGIIQKKERLKFITSLVLIFSVSTNLIILIAGLNAGKIKNSKIFISSDERQAFDWLDKNTDWGDIILSSPEMGMFIPGWTGARVVYGHPYETVNAIEKEKLVNEFFEKTPDNSNLQGYLEDNRIKYIFCGPREMALASGNKANFSRCICKYSNQTVEIFQCQ